ncbi:diguanylate cyclase [Amycolatopsis sp. NPDC059019]|uniref:GGDEF domain-containing protein n=1 Tax=Amycolatopsis sp. NPDC059019 TaxID=3346702 RepID=UPI00366AAC30
MWSLPRSALHLVLLVNAVALAITVFSSLSVSVSRTELIYFIILTVGAILHLETARTIERRREQGPKRAPYTNLKSLWVLAALLLVPLPLVIALTVVSYLYCWVRVYGPSIAYRKVYSASTFIVASAAASAVLHSAGLAATPRLPHTPWALLIIVAATGTWWLTNYALVVGAIMLSSDEPITAREALGHPADQLVVTAALGLGVVMAVLLVHEPWALPAPLIATIAVHRDLLLPQYERRARTDDKTGLATPVHWTAVVDAELRRAAITRTSVGVLFIDLDDFKSVNDTFGHPAGDQAIKAVARAVQAEVRSRDLVCRWGGDELAVMLPSIGHDQLLAVANRIHAQLARTPVTMTETKTGTPHTLAGVALSMGVASYPDDGASADQLILAADRALLEAKEAGRNQIRTAMPPGHSTVVEVVSAAPRRRRQPRLPS